MNIEKRKEINEKKFRINARHLFLTYSSISLDLTREEIVKQLKSKIGIKNFLVAKEYHKDETPHFHVYLHLETKCDIKNVSFFDLFFDSKVIHGNYQPVKGIDKVLAYITKDDRNYLKSEGLKMFVDEMGQSIPLKQHILNRARIVGTRVALQEYIKENTLEALNNIVSFEKAINKILEIETIDPLISKYGLTDLENVPLEVVDWSQIEGPAPTLILVGSAGIGKTTLAKALGHGKKILFLKKDLEGLKDFNSHEMIVVDDACFNTKNEQELISMFETENPTSIRILYKTVNLNQVRMILTVNDLKQVLNKKELLSNQLLRRVQVVKLEERIVYNTKIVNNTYNIFFDSNQIEKNKNLFQNELI